MLNADDDDAGSGLDQPAEWNPATEYALLGLILLGCLVVAALLLWLAKWLKGLEPYFGWFAYEHVGMYLYLGSAAAAVGGLWFTLREIPSIHRRSKQLAANRREEV